MSRRNISNKLLVEFAPGGIVRWRKRRFVVADCMGFEAIIAREVGRRRLERIPVAEVQPDHSINQRAVTNLVTVPEDQWQTAVRQFTVLKRLLEVDGIERTRAAAEKVAKILKKHPFFSSFTSFLPFRPSKRSSTRSILRGSRPRRGSSFDRNVFGACFSTFCPSFSAFAQAASSSRPPSYQSLAGGGKRHNRSPPAYASARLKRQR